MERGLETLVAMRLITSKQAMTFTERIYTSVRSRPLFETAILYTIALTTSAFVALFVLGGMTVANLPNPEIWMPLGFGIWIISIVWVTVLVVRAGLGVNLSRSVTPLLLLQGVLVVFTLTGFIFDSDRDWNMFSGMLLVWEAWGALFTLSFLMLAALMRQSLGWRTWASSLTTAAVIFYSVYRRI